MSQNVIIEMPRSRAKDSLQAIDWLIQFCADPVYEYGNEAEMLREYLAAALQEEDDEP